jgi:hypothetical protein
LLKIDTRLGVDDFPEGLVRIYSPDPSEFIRLAAIVRRLKSVGGIIELDKAEGVTSVDGTSLQIRWSAEHSRLTCVKQREYQLELTDEGLCDISEAIEDERDYGSFQWLWSGELHPYGCYDDCGILLSCTEEGWW